MARRRSGCGGSAIQQAVHAISLLALAWCAGWCVGACGSPPDVGDAGDMAGTSIGGMVGGASVAFETSVAADDPRCGPRGLALLFPAAAGQAATDGACGPGDAGGGALAPGLSVFLSDFRPGIYVFTGPVSCRAAPHGLGFFASWSGSGAGPDDGGDGGNGGEGGDGGGGSGEIDARGGEVIVQPFESGVSGTLDLQFADSRVAGHFSAGRCVP